ncbi:MAG: winged helix DNA-binding domain-containing protein [Chloroflexota bacterium]
MESSPGPVLTARQLNRATLARQMLLVREPIGAVEALGRVFALQSQEPASPYIALWNRVTAFDPAQLDVAFDNGAIVKATLMRITLHAVAAGDYPILHGAMQTTLRAARLNDRRFKAAGMSAADAEALVEETLAFAAEPRTNADVEAWLADRLGSAAHPGFWWAMRQVGPFVHAPTGGPWSFGPRPSHRAANLRPDHGGAEASIAHLVRRYFEAFGPATVQDVAQFTLLQMPRIRSGVAALGDELVSRDGPDGTRLIDVRGGVIPHHDSPAPPRLLPMWDSTLLAYRDRSRMIPPVYRRVVIQSNGDVLPTVLVDGYVAGVWRPLDGGIEVTALHPFTDETWWGLESEAADLMALLADRDPTPYRRYGRWWAGLAGAERRTIGG